MEHWAEWEYQEGNKWLPNSKSDALLSPGSLE